MGDVLFVFGGEDPRRVSLGDLWCLHLPTLVWSRPKAQGAAPAARAAHTAVSYLHRYVVVFGGGSISTCSSELYVLDTCASPMTWSQPQVSSGLLVTPRAGHSAAVVGSAMYTVGGGDGKQGEELGEEGTQCECAGCDISFGTTAVASPPALQAGRTCLPRS